MSIKMGHKSIMLVSLQNMPINKVYFAEIAIISVGNFHFLYTLPRQFPYLINYIFVENCMLLSF